MKKPRKNGVRKLTAQQKAELLARLGKAAKKKTHNPVGRKQAKKRKKPAGRSPLKSHLTQMKRAVKTGSKDKSKLAKARARAKRPNPAVTHRSRGTAGASRVPANRVKSGYARSRRRNPDDMAEAAAMYEVFHGRPANRIVDYDEALEYRSELAELGKLIELRVHIDGISQPIPLLDFKSCQVTCTPDGRNIYFVGGDQYVDLDHLGIASDKDYVELGDCPYIKYFTKKGFHNFEPVEYWHRFGEENGIRPVLAYDSMNRKLFLIGGDYQCKPEGIVN